jgi:dolichol-phosphate mannosyltransferase
MEVQLVMPVYNEEACIGEVVGKWSRQLEDTLGAGNFKMTIVNDGSRDRTGRILDELAGKFSCLDIVHQKNGGHGSAVLTGYRRAVAGDAAWVFQTDSDDQFDPVDFGNLWANRDRSEFILGCRQVRHDALHRKVITRIAKSLNLLLFGVYVPDANIPYRLMKRETLKTMLAELKEDVFAPNIFLSVIARRRGVDTLDIPVSHYERETGTVSIVRWKLIKVCFRCVRELVEFRFSRPQSTSLSQEKLSSSH